MQHAKRVAGRWGLMPVWMALWALLLAAVMPAHAGIDPNTGPGGPILVVTSPASTYSRYYAEILRTEGLNAFAVADLATLSPTTLAAYDVVVLPKMALTAAQVTTLSDWVNAGGNLIAMGPDPQLAGLLGLTPLGTTLSNAYLRVATGSAPGNGIVGETIQFHGSADRYGLSGATAVATLYSDAVTATTSPAVTLRSVGAGHAAAFAFDLATSIVQTRQGNPLWAAQERDGYTPIRSDDKYFGAAAGNVQPDWVDLGKVAIPQADEQQRLLANLILTVNANRKPLPRFWYFPNGKKAVVVMTGDDHGNNGTAGRFDQFKAASPAGCSVADWECVRGTSYIYPGTPLTAAQAAAYAAEGFEVGLHIDTQCGNYTLAQLQGFYSQQVAQWQAKYGGVGPLRTQRHHCIAWSDWSSGAEVQLQYGMRMDTSYYYWPPSWANNVPGLFTGSAMPMRFARLDGSFVDVYQAATQMTDESGQSYPFTVDTLLDRALGAEGYYGAYVINAHTDVATEVESDETVRSAKARGVPIVSAQQLLAWLDARGESSFGGLGFSNGALTFNVTKAAAATGLRGMLPTRFGTRALAGLTRAGTAVGTTVSVVKGVEYAFFAADAGAYVATYAADTAAPTVSSRSPAPGATGVATNASVTATFGEAMTAGSIGTATFELRTAANALVGATVGYDAATRVATLRPANPLAAGATYTATLRGGTTEPTVKDAAGNPLPASLTWTFTTGAPPQPPACDCTAWSATATPATPQVNDSAAVELGVKFRVDFDGTVRGIRFYKGTGNTGTHVGSLWSASGTRLATATFQGESASGWQQVLFAQPVAVTANTVYVASYYAPNGNYAGDGGYFATRGVDNGPVHLLQNGVGGGNGVYRYGTGGGFPASTYNATNYWVDVVYAPATGADTTAPTVTATAPAAGATGVATGSVVTATFSEALDTASVSGSTFDLRIGSNAPVTAAVTYDAASRTARLAPAVALAASTTYTATLRGGATDPRIKDSAGNALAATTTWSFTTAAAATGGCSAPANAIVAENCLAGSPASEWDVAGIGDPSLQGFATDISVDKGGTVTFKVATNATSYRFDIYRLGWYNGAGARKVATVNPSASLPQTQPSCLTQSTTGLIDCGNWAVSGSWAVPASAVSGIYLARLVRPDTGGASHIVFVVRDDAGTSPLLFQTSDTTWQAYNNYGGNSLYTGAPAGRAYKVSYNRPFHTRAVDNGQDWLFNSEFPMLRWLERNGYDVSYTTGADSDRRGNLITRHGVFLSVGHDEYWSGAQRAHVTAARNAGVDLAFFSGNEVFWKTRWEASIDGSNTAHRTLVSYKETHANAKIDPSPEWTGTWRDPRFSPPSDGGRPENELTGTLFLVNDGATTAITVPAADGRMRFWRNTSVAALAPGDTATLPNGTLGYEWDVDAANAVRPAGLVRLSTTTVNNAPILIDHGSTFGSGPATHALTLYRHASGARVFGAGTVQWAWGLDATHDRPGTPVSASMQQATVNLFADMGVQPATLQSGLVAATASSDATPPTSTIASPAAGATVDVGTPVTVSGTASDAGGGVVGGVEVSVDGGATWRPASGRGTWTYAWTPTASGTATLRVRAADDSANLETPAAGIAVTVRSGAPQTCPCTLFPATAVPAVASDGDTGSVNLGMRFTSDEAGMVTAIRFYKGPANTGTHVGALWSGSGALLATATFQAESASGWQQVELATPVAVSANTTYVVSYLAPRGGYAANSGYFATAPTDRPPLHAPAGANGVYTYGTATAFPTSTYQSTNYWVDVVFSPGAPPPDTTPPTVTANTPASGATGVGRGVNVTATFSEAMNAASIGGGTVELRPVVGGTPGAPVAAAVTYDAAGRRAILDPNAALAAQTTYRATVRGGATGVKDAAGNALAQDRVWTFTTR